MVVKLIKRKDEDMNKPEIFAKILQMIHCQIHDSKKVINYKSIYFLVLACNLNELSLNINRTCQESRVII